MFATAAVLFLGAAIQQTASPVDAHFVLDRQEVYWGDPVYFRVEWENRSSQTVKVPKSVSLGPGSLIIHFSCSDKKLRFRAPGGYEGVGDVPSISLPPGERWTANYDLIDMVALAHQHPKFWQQALADGEFQLEISIRHADLDTRYQVVKTIVLHERPDGQRETILELSRKAALFAKANPRYHRQTLNKFCAGAPVDFVGRPISSAARAFEELGGTETTLSPGPLHNAVYFAGMIESIGSELSLLALRQREADKLLRWLDTLPTAERTLLARHLRSRVAYFGNLSTESKALLKELYQQLDDGLEKGHFVATP